MEVARVTAQVAHVSVCLLYRPKSLDPYIQKDRIADRAVVSTHVCDSSSSEESCDAGSESD